MLDRGRHRPQPQDVEPVGDQEQEPGQRRRSAHQPRGIERHGDRPSHRGQLGIDAAIAPAHPIGQPPAREHADRAADQQQRPDILRRGQQAEPERADQDGRHPEGEAIAAQRTERRGKAQQPETRLGGQDAEHRPHRRALGRRDRIERSARRLAHHQAEDRRDDDARQPDDDERPAPIDMRRQYPAQQRPRGQPDRDAQRIDRQRPPALMRREIIRNHRIGRRNAPRLADPDAQAEREELPETGREPAQRGKAAPHRQADRNHPAAARPVGDQRQRNGERRIEQRERRPAQQPQLRVGQL